MTMTYCPPTGSMSQFDVVMLSNQQYRHHLEQTKLSKEDRAILPFTHRNQDLQCNYTSPLQQPPQKSPMMTCTHSRRSPIYTIHDQAPGTDDNSPLDSIHATHYQSNVMIILNTLNKSPVVESVSPHLKGTHSQSFYMCRLSTPEFHGHFQWTMTPQSWPIKR